MHKIKKYFINLILTFTLVLSLSFTIFAGSDDDWCKDSVDLTTSLPPVYKYQDDLGFCYAFAATTLIENYACKQSKTSPCETLSVMDAILQYQVSTMEEINNEHSTPYSESGYADKLLDILINIMDAISPSPYQEISMRPFENHYEPSFPFFHESGSPDKLLEILRKDGICSNQMAPYDIFQSNSSARANWFALAYHFNHFRFNHASESCSNKLSIDDEIKEIIFTLSFAEDRSSVMDENRIISAISASNGTDFLKSIMVPDKCVQNRKIYDFEIFRHGYEEYQSPITKKRAFRWYIANNLARETPLLINIYCTETSSEVCKGSGGAHSVIVKGMRQNKETGKCELLILNSYGYDWQFNRDGGYVDANNVVENTYELMWLE